MYRMRLVCAALLGVAMTASTMPAMAAEPPAPSVAETAVQFDQALDDVGAAPAAPTPDVDLPDDGQRKAGLDTDAGRVVMKLPVTEHLDDDGLTRVFDGRATDTTVAVSPTSDGMRALVSLETPQAPVRHRFAMGGDVALLVGDDEGYVHAFGADGDYLATAETPWAVDAEGREVPTRYEIDGTALVQIVEHRDQDYTYPITADPWWVIPLVRVVVRAVSKAKAKTKVQAAKAAGKSRTSSKRIVARVEGTMNRKIKPCLAGGGLAFLPLGTDLAWEVYEDGTGAMSSRKFTLLATSSVAGCIGMALGK